MPACACCMLLATRSPDDDFATAFSSSSSAPPGISRAPLLLPAPLVATAFPAFPALAVAAAAFSCIAMCVSINCLNRISQPSMMPVISWTHCEHTPDSRLRAMNPIMAASFSSVQYSCERLINLWNSEVFSALQASNASAYVASPFNRGSALYSLSSVAIAVHNLVR